MNTPRLRRGGDSFLFIYFIFYVKGVLPREVAQAVEVPRLLEATELGRVM